MANEELFRAHFAVDVRTNCEAIAVSPNEKTVDLRDLVTREVTTHPHDKLVLSPGAAAVHPPLPGIDLPGIFHVKTVPDARKIHVFCRSSQRAYYATRILVQNGFNAKTVSGGMLSLAHNYLFGTGGGAEQGKAVEPVEAKEEKKPMAAPAR